MELLKERINGLKKIILLYRYLFFEITTRLPRLKCIFSMNKHITITSVFFFFSTPAVSTPFHGFYLGAKGGVTFALTQMQQTRSLDFRGITGGGDGPPSITMEANDFYIGRYGITGGLSFGYSQCIENTLIGLEIQENFQNVTVPFDPALIVSPVFDWRGDTVIKIKNDFSMILRMGSIFKENTLFYGFLGPDIARFKVYGSETFSANFDGNTFTLQGNHNHSKYHWGFLTGVGIERIISRKITAGLQYNYQYYGHLDFDVVGPFLIQTNKTKSTTNKFLINLNYYFC
jgi:hypothetical protein